MGEDDKIILKDGKQYCTLPDTTQVLIENEITTDPNWITVHQAEKLLGLGDRQIRNLAAKNSWDKKYAYINKKPVRHYYKPQLGNYLKSRVTEAIFVSPNNSNQEKNQNDSTEREAFPGKSLISKNTVEELDAILKKVEPYVGDFLETYKKNQERIISLEDKKGTAEKKAVFWKTSAAWMAGVSLLALLAWYKVDHTNSTLSKSNGDLSGKYESAQKELYETKLILNQKDYEIGILKAGHKDSAPANNPTVPGKE